MRVCVCVARVRGERTTLRLCKAENLTRKTIWDRVMGDRFQAGEGGREGGSEGE